MMVQGESDPILNCATGVCCIAGSIEQRDALVALMPLSWGDDKRCEYAEWLMAHFDLAPVGTLGALKAAIAQLARQG